MQIKYNYNQTKQQSEINKITPNIKGIKANVLMNVNPEPFSLVNAFMGCVCLIIGLAAMYLMMWSF